MVSKKSQAKERKKNNISIPNIEKRKKYILSVYMQQKKPICMSFVFFY